MREHHGVNDHPTVLLVIAFVLALGSLAGIAQAAPSISANFFANVDNPVDIANAGDTRIFVVDQDGEIVVFDSTGASLGTFLDIQDRVIAGGERGLLGLAFHPNYASNGFLLRELHARSRRHDVGRIGRGRYARFALQPHRWRRLERGRSGERVHHHRHPAALREP